MESSSADSVSPVASQYGSNASSPYRSNLSKQRTASFVNLERAELAQVDSGVFENAPQSMDANVARETDSSNEMELPEQGITKSLVAQWRAAETGSVGTPARMGTPSRVSRSPSVSSAVKVRSSAPSVRRVVEEAEKGEREECSGVGETQLLEAEKLEEESLPPANITRNLLAMFKTLEGDSGGPSGSALVDSTPSEKV